MSSPSRPSSSPEHADRTHPPAFAGSRSNRLATLYECIENGQHVDWAATDDTGVVQSRVSRVYPHDGLETVYAPPMFGMADCRDARPHDAEYDAVIVAPRVEWSDPTDWRRGEAVVVAADYAVATITADEPTRDAVDDALSKLAVATERLESRGIATSADDLASIV